MCLYNAACLPKINKLSLRLAVLVSLTAKDWLLDSLAHREYSDPPMRLAKQRGSDQLWRIGDAFAWPGSFLHHGEAGSLSSQFRCYPASFPSAVRANHSPRAPVLVLLALVAPANNPIMSLKGLVWGVVGSLTQAGIVRFLSASFSVLFDSIRSDSGSVMLSIARSTSWSFGEGSVGINEPWWIPWSKCID